MENQEIKNEQTQNQEQSENETPNTSKNQQNELILGKFKSVEDLAKAYQNIQTQLGQQSSEVGELRKKADEYDNMQNQKMQMQELTDSFQKYIDEVVPKYKKEEYFLNPEFQNLFKAAYSVAGSNLDTDTLVSLLEAYTKSRIDMHEKNKSAKSETENIKAEMGFSQSDAKQSKQKIPNMSDMSANEIDELIAKYI